MRLIASGFIALLFVGCSQTPPPEPPRPAPATNTAPKALEARHSPSAVVEVARRSEKIPLLPPSPARLTTHSAQGITFEGVTFDSRSHRLAVIDQSGGPGSRFPDAARAAASCQAIAAINAGFFTPEGDPLGLVVSNGRASGAWNSASSLGSGVWLQQPSGHLSIVRRQALGKSVAKSQQELIQAGPMLIENSRPVSGLENAKSTVRTLILWDGNTRWWIGQASACTLLQLSQALAHTQPAGWPVRHALNLDGGRSSDLWVSSNVSGGPLTRRAPWNRPVRNFLALVPR
ncbi:MAG: phosphodiester glycosidase family protein [Luteolibacter sp.]